MGEEQNYSWIQQGSNFYKVDESGNMIFTPEIPEDMTGVYVAERDTGETVDDPSTKRIYYSVGKGYARNTDGYRLRAKGKKQRKDDIRKILSGSENTDADINTVSAAETALHEVYKDDSQFGRFFKNDGNLRKRALRNKKFLNELSKNRYSSNENYREIDGVQTISMGTDKDAETFTNRLNRIIHPELTKVFPGHFESSRVRRNNSRNNTRVVTRNPQDRSDRPEKRCIKCEKQKKLANAGRFQNTSTSTRVKNRSVKKPKLTWVERNTDNIGAKINTSYEYDQTPVIETLYAQPFQGSEKTIVEQQQTLPITTTSSSSSETISRPIKKSLTHKKSSKPTKPITTITRSISKKTTPSQSASKQYKIYYDPDGKEIKREIVNEKIGGLLKYISK